MPANREVDRWFAQLDHPLKDVMLAVRTAIVGADPRITETIKWKSPTFVYEGNLASINPRAKQFVSLMFHRGAAIPGNHPALQGGGEQARYMRFGNAAEVSRLRPDLESAVRAWCDWRNAEVGSGQRR
jgi:hypothetical protein